MACTDVVAEEPNLSVRSMVYSCDGGGDNGCAVWRWMQWRRAAVLEGDVSLHVCRCGRRSDIELETCSVVQVRYYLENNGKVGTTFF